MRNIRSKEFLSIQSLPSDCWPLQHWLISTVNYPHVSYQRNDVINFSSFASLFSSVRFLLSRISIDFTSDWKEKRFYALRSQDGKVVYTIASSSCESKSSYLVYVSIFSQRLPWMWNSHEHQIHIENRKPCVGIDSSIDPPTGFFYSLLVNPSLIMRVI